MNRQKGTQFERKLCRQLSLWWSSTNQDDLFWRTASSGGRATRRTQQGKRTTGHYGDIQSTDPSSAPLMRFTTIEAKRGYHGASGFDLIDYPTTPDSQRWAEFLQQAITQAHEAGSLFWWLITQRDLRRTLISFPLRLYNTLRVVGARRWHPRPYPMAMFSVNVHSWVVEFVTMELEEFLFRCPRSDVEFILKHYDRETNCVPEKVIKACRPARV